MKKNILSILILALLIVNIVLTAIMMFSVVGMTKKTSALVTDIASIIKIDMAEGVEEAPAESIPMSDVAVYELPDAMTIPLKMGEDGVQHYAVVAVSLSMNMKDKGYEEHNASLKEKQSLIQNQIIDVFGSHTIEEAQSNQDALKAEITKKLQEMYDSKFIFNVNFSDIKFQ
ncbi:MAG: flagellar basal body-associated FliL family protein [Clostridiales bacterium]|nr:flagellar basal body-associated FliL family protein [Clostridiales bacterium]